MEISENKVIKSTKVKTLSKPRVKNQGRNMNTKSFNDGGTRMTKQRAMNDFREDKT